MRSRLLPATLLGALPFVAIDARAAGGHFDVDDAAVLAPGHCQYELWANRAPSRGADDLHLGPSCRLGPFEIGIDFDRTWAGPDTATLAGPHLKGVLPLPVAGLTVGAVIGTALDLRPGGGKTQAFYFPLTWAVSSAWAFNVNAGWDRADGTTHRLGASAEWSPNARVTVIGEHVRTGGALVSRFGTRFVLGPSVSIDVSAAQIRAAGRLYTVGVNHDFAR